MDDVIYCRDCKYSNPDDGIWIWQVKCRRYPKAVNKSEFDTCGEAKRRTPDE